MTGYILRRILMMIPTLIIISMISFVIIQLPPGDFLTTYVANLSQSGAEVNAEQVEALRTRYGLDQPIHVQYWKWISGVMVGDFGRSFAMNKPVSELIWERLWLSVLLSFTAIFVSWLVAIPIGIYSATHQYTFFDTSFTFLAFMGISWPAFSLALVLMYFANTWFGISVGGLFSPEFADAPWSILKCWDLFKHMWVPVLVLVVGGAGGMVRTVRANLLDQLEMPYVVTARAKGLSEWRLLLKYPVRIAINPLISSIGWMLPQLLSGSVIVAMVLNLPTTGPLLITALQDQDMYLAGSFVLLLSVLTVIGTLISDILLAWLDPRIRYEKVQS